MDAVGEVSYFLYAEIAPPQSFHDLRAFQVKAATHRFRREVR